MQLPVREVFDEAIGHKARHVLPVVVPFVSKFFLEHRANRNQGRKSVSEENELQEERPAQSAETCGQYDGHEAGYFDDRCKELEEPHIRKCQGSNTAVPRTIEHVRVPA